MRPINLFFMHIPKTAGRYMWSLISANFRRGRARFWEPHVSNGILSRRNDLSIDAISGHLPYTTVWLFPDKDVFTYTVFREPTERTFSNYLHFTRMRPDLHVGLDEFISKTTPNIQSRMLGSSIPIGGVSNSDAVSISVDEFFTGSVEHERDNVILDTAILRLSKLGTFGIKERLKESGDRLAKITGLTINVEERDSEHGKHARCLSARDRRSIEEINMLDIDLYLEAVKRFENSHCQSI